MLLRNQVFCLKNWKVWQASIFFTRFLLTNVYKRVFGIFFILFRSWVICKNKKDLVSKHSFFIFLLINNDTLLKTLLSRKRVQNLSKKILIFVAVGARQSFKFFRQIACFLGNNRVLSKFRYRILNNLISIIKL